MKPKTKVKIKFKEELKMKMKRLLAVALAALMAATLAPAVPAKADVIDGTTVYVNQEIYDLTLPTTASQKFFLDPQGLIAIGDESAGTDSDGGQVIGKNKMYAVNRSSKPVALTASYKLTGSVSSNEITIEDTSVSANDIKSATGRTVAISISAVESDKDDKDATNVAGSYKGHVFKVNESNSVDMTVSANWLSSDDVVYSNTDGENASYIMTEEAYMPKMKSGKTDAYDPASYEFVIDSTKKEASCVKLEIGGYCSTQTDWSDYAKGDKELKLEIIFKFKKVNAADKTAVTVDSAVAGPSVTMTDAGVITITGLTSKCNTVSLDLFKLSNGTETKNGSATLIKLTDASAYSDKDGGTVIFQLASSMSSWNGKSVTLSITLSDGSVITSDPVTLNM